MSINNKNDPFEELENDIFKNETSIEIRVDKVRGRKKITTVSGFSSKTMSLKDVKNITKNLKKYCACASTAGQLKQNENIDEPYFFTLQSDHAKFVKQYLVQKEFAKENEIEIHGIAEV